MIQNNTITCCYKCVAPKRHPGCHGTCPEYIKEREEHQRQVDARRAEIWSPIRQYKNEKVRARLHKEDLKKKQKGGSLQ